MFMKHAALILLSIIRYLFNSASEKCLPAAFCTHPSHFYPQQHVGSAESVPPESACKS